MLVSKIGVVLLNVMIMGFIVKVEKDYIKKFNLYKYTLLIFLLLVIVIFRILVNIDFIANIIQDSKYPFFDKIPIFLISISISLIINLFFARRLQTLQERITIRNLEKKDIKKIEKFDYYREIIKDTSPANIAYSNEKKIKLDNVVVTTILSLEKQGKIKIENNKVILLNDMESLNLFEHEKLILSFFNNEISLKRLKKNFMHDLFNDLEKEKIIINKNSKKMNSTYILELFIIWQILFSLIMLEILFATSTFGIVVFIAYFLTFMTIPIYKAIEAKIHPVVRTKKGLEIAAKIDGLKKYIIDFSNISKTGLDNINLFDDYVIYAIILDIPGKLNREAKLKYKNLISKRNKITDIYCTKKKMCRCKD